MGNCKLALQHNIGLGGAAVVALYKMAVEPKDSGVKVEGFKSSDVFETIKNSLSENGAEMTKKVGGVFLFKVTGEKGATASWIVDAKNGSGSVAVAKEDDNLNLLLSGKLAAQQAYFQGRLKIKGNMGLAMKLQQLMKSNSAQIKAKL